MAKEDPCQWTDDKQDKSAFIGQRMKRGIQRWRGRGKPTGAYRDLQWVTDQYHAKRGGGRWSVRSRCDRSRVRGAGLNPKRLRVY